MKQLKRCFLNIKDIEIEVCQDVRGIYFVRHHIYWSIAYGKKNPDLERNCVIYNLELLVNNRLSTVKWAGYKFQLEKVCFDDGMEVDTILIPLQMFADFIGYHANNRGNAPDYECTRLVHWLQDNSLKELAIANF
ncbi:MAG: hypothetical protein VKK42_21930 [Lyngbya sp.]|nr:hypothetical protein [Lyngbya sp.]